MMRYTNPRTLIWLLLHWCLCVYYLQSAESCTRTSSDAMRDKIHRLQKENEALRAALAATEGLFCMLCLWSTNMPA